jgi:hypothetical protein
MQGTVYLLHFEPGLPVTGTRVARHYLGWTEGDVDDRLAQHVAGRGSPLVHAAVSAGATVTACARAASTRARPAAADCSC